MSQRQHQEIDDPGPRLPTSPAPRSREPRSTAEELRDQAEALTEADRRKDEFIAMLAHELRSPLAPIRNALETLRHRRQCAHRPLEHEIQVIDRQLEHLTVLVDDLLDVARITRGRIELRRENVSLSSVVELAVETVEPELTERRQPLEISMPSTQLLVHGDRVRLAQVLANLLSNASKYSDPGSPIELTAERSAEGTVIRVEDHGIGMPPGRVDSVFDGFFQMDGSLDRRGGGLGLGLGLVKALTEMHGGSVAAESDGPGRGSVFTVRLPPAPRGLAGPEASGLRAGAGADGDRGRGGGGADRGDGGGRRVLVVDDSVDTAESFAELLQLKGHEVRTVHDGAAALAICPEFRPDVVFLDIGLPEMTGYEVAERLSRALERRPLLVAVTGYGQEETRRRAREAGIDHHLLKPIDLHTVLDILNRAGSR
jgi:CheY-like chemotaxis protein